MIEFRRLTDEVDEISLRREAFYERCGYRANIHPHVHPPYRAGFPGHELVVMSRPEKLSHAEYGEFAEYLKKRVMGQRGIDKRARQNYTNEW